jgi:hypothetical protein
VGKALLYRGVFFLYNNNMDNEQEKAKYLSQNAKPVPTWFFEREDDTVFACGEEEAWNIIKNRNLEKRFKLIGHSDGVIYFKTIKNANNEVVELREQMQRLQEDLTKYLQTEDDLRFKQLKDDDDGMVVRVVAKRTEVSNKIKEVNDQLMDINKTIVDKAFNLELEVAKQNKTQPKNSDVYTPNNEDRDIILRNLGR